MCAPYHYDNSKQEPNKQVALSITEYTVMYLLENAVLYVLYTFYGYKYTSDYFKIWMYRMKA